MKIAFRHLPFTAEQVQSLNALAHGAGFETLWFDPDTAPTAQLLRDCEVLMSYFPADLFRELPALKWIQTPAAGVEKLCGAVYANEDVVLSNCSGAFGVAIAEYMLTGLLMLMRHMPTYLENQKKHIWRGAGLCRSIYGSRITVVGMGDIGSKFAARAKALGAHVRGVRRTVQGIPEHFDEVFPSERLAEAVADVDAVVMCLPGTKQTTGMLNAEAIAAMSPRTIVVNCGRGYTIDQDALTLALAQKRIAGAVLDVAAVEPLPADHPLWDLENVIITPHISGHDDDPINAQAIYDIFSDNLRCYIAGEPLTHTVNRTRGY